MRQFYIAFLIWHTVCAELSWSHYKLILSLGHEKARGFLYKRSSQRQLALDD